MLYGSSPSLASESKLTTNQLFFYDHICIQRKTVPALEVVTAGAMQCDMLWHSLIKFAYRGIIGHLSTDLHVIEGAAVKY